MPGDESVIVSIKSVMCDRSMSDAESFLQFFSDGSVMVVCERNCPDCPYRRDARR